MLTVDWSCPGYNGVDGQVPRLSETEREQLRHSLPGTALHHGKENKDTSIPAMLHLRDNPHFVFLPLASSLPPSPLSPFPLLSLFTCRVFQDALMNPLLVLYSI